MVQTVEERRAKQAEWRASHRQEQSEYTRKWRAANPERTREIQRNYEARKRAMRPVPVIPPPQGSECTLAELAYAAGLLDGEGNLHIAVWKKSYLPVVTITNTDRRLVDWMAERFGGHVYGRPRNNPIHKIPWDWRVVGKHAAAFASLVLPYLVLKQPQAELLISYYAHGTFHWSNQPLPQKVQERRRQMHEAMKAMNKRGKQPSFDGL